MMARPSSPKKPHLPEKAERHPLEKQNDTYLKSRTKSSRSAVGKASRSATLTPGGVSAHTSLKLWSAARGADGWVSWDPETQWGPDVFADPDAFSRDEFHGFSGAPEV